MKTIKPEAFYKKSNLDGVGIIPFETAVVGIINSDLELREGQLVSGIVRKITEKGIKLKHIQIC